MAQLTLRLRELPGHLAVTTTLGLRAAEKAGLAKKVVEAKAAMAAEIDLAASEGCDS